MTLYQFHDNSDTPMDAHFEVQEGELILHSRGGAIGTANAQNTEYGPALRILLERIFQSNMTLVGVWVDSSRVQHLSAEERQIFFPEDTEVSLTKLFTRLSNRMAVVGRDPKSHSRGNTNKRLRFAFTGISAAQIARIATRGQTDAVSIRQERLSVAELNRVSADHIWHAVQRLLFSSVEHPFGESKKFDVITDDGSRFPPKVVFGLAASEVLGFEVQSWHFANGIGTPSFKAIKAAGFQIVRKGGPVPSEVAPRNPDDREWIEGHRKLVTHLRRERASGLAQAKKAEFEREHGKLFCEICELDPAKAYMPEISDACIEVHHRRPLADMTPGQITQLEDLMCLCANCHRVIHRKIRNNCSASPECSDVIGKIVANG